MLQEKVEAIENVLPHGSGINYDWEIRTKGNRLYVHNAWDYMDENGYYDDVFPFVVCYENNNFKYIHFVNCSRRQYHKIERAGLRDYLEYMFCELEDKIASVFEME